jgi:CheY-like chemotaxis protein
MTIELGDQEATTQTILIVEDDEDVIEVVSTHLSRLGYHIILARCGREALAELRQATPVDLLFTDFSLPENMNGAELAVEARRLRPHIKVLLTTGYHAGPAPPRDGAETFPILTKPYRQSELTAKIRDALSDGRAEGNPGPP